MHMNDLVAASALAHKLECAKDTLKRTSKPGDIVKAHHDNIVQVSVNLPVLLDDGKTYAVACFPLPTDMIIDTIAEFRARLKKEVTDMEVELRKLGITATEVN